jgi:predicted membrane-bound dolichyl-phosphate-mannose-protein mannosyltransferase
MQHQTSYSDYFIIAFVAIVFIAGGITVFKFMRKK